MVLGRESLLPSVFWTCTALTATTASAFGLHGSDEDSCVVCLLAERVDSPRYLLVEEIPETSLCDSRYTIASHPLGSGEAGRTATTGDRRSQAVAAAALVKGRVPGSLGPAFYYRGYEASPSTLVESARSPPSDLL